MAHDWELIERLLHEAQNSADDSFKPRLYAEQLAGDRLEAGIPLEGSVDHLKQIAGDLEGVLYQGGFIEPRTTEQGGTGNNFVLTARGARLLSLIGSSFPESVEFRRRLDEQGEIALDGEVFDQLADSVART
ncbi:transcriptional regulator [Pseudomonas sp. RIT-PI-AD]|uniref:transcriptional regulator n=1 Tax=Pseudomonas sp. RIT-PI-AD TaxID=3035294 RepID=UPI0021D94CEE|nr:transcriptional regulator [Pseudomonas sp. RIT-PI-AD]